MIENHLITSFLALFDQGSVTRAAHALGLQQPTVSLHLRTLRQIFEDPLFIRQGGQMLPTPRAAELVGPCRAILEQLANLGGARQTFDPLRSNHVFRIAMTDASQVTLLPTILDHLSVHAPGISISVSLIDSELARHMARGEVDLALGYIPWLEQGCRQQALYSQNWVCLANRGIGTISRATYPQADHVRIASGTGAQLLDEALADARIEQRVKLVLPGFLGLAAILGRRDYIATIPEHTAAVLSSLDSRLNVQPLPIPAQGFRVCQYWHERFDRHPPLLWLRKVCGELLTREGLWGVSETHNGGTPRRREPDRQGQDPGRTALRPRPGGAR